MSQMKILDQVLFDTTWTEEAKIFCSGAQENVLLVTSGHWVRQGIHRDLKTALNSASSVTATTVTPNPDLEYLSSTVRTLKTKNITKIIALGGGSVIDSAKVFSAWLSKPYPPPMDEFFESQGVLDLASAIPVCAIPTTTGTGSEVTPFATVWDKKRNQKLSIESSVLAPKVVVCDPSLLASLRGQTLLFPALDAVSHALESLWNHNRTPETESLAYEALYLIDRHLGQALQEQTQTRARAQLQLASIFAGQAIAKTKTAIAHSISYPLTLQFGIPHGLAVSFLLPALIQIHTLKRDEKDPGLLDKIGRHLEQLKLGERVLEYASVEEIVHQIPEMTTSPRFRNFSDSAIGQSELSDLLASVLTTS
jgi:phosphonate metabolism-associated iron-containing alcohol dehydrogenase